MVHLIAILVIASNPASRESKRDGVRIEVTVRSSVYTWNLTNRSAAPITEFEVGQHAGYDFRVPEGWSFETTRDRFRAWTDDDARAIRRGNTATFSQRVSSTGAVLGRVAAKVGLAHGPPVEFASIWGPQPEPASTVLAVPAVVIVIVLGHALLLARRERRQTPADSTDA